MVEADLLAMGSQIAQLIEEKNKAVDNEDYDRYVCFSVIAQLVSISLLCVYAITYR